MVNDHCPSNGHRTMRAQAVERDLTADLSSVNVDTARRVLIRTRDDLRHLATHGLCVDCGFPLDKSAPYPAWLSRPEATVQEETTDA